MISSKFYIFISFFFSYLALAQVTFRAVPGKEKVQEGEDFDLNFVLTLKEQTNIEPINYPSFNGFKMIGRKRSQQLNIVNGEKSLQNIETLILRPEKKGKIKIGSASIKVDGEIYETNEVVINVTDVHKTPSINKANQIVFLDIEMSQDSAFLNEPVYATVKLYSKSYDALRRRSDVEAPNLNKFQVKKLPISSEYRDISQEVIDNQVYVSEVVGKYVLMPQRTGLITIPSFAVRVAIPIDFFEERVVELYSPEQELRVKILPKNAPKSFKGAVGNFTFNTYVNKNNLEENKAFEIKVELLGKGNLSLIKLPKLNLNEDLEVYKPKRQDAYKEIDNIQKGKITETYVVVPQYGGDYEIPSMEFTYFDPSIGKYVTLQSENLVLNIKGKNKQVSDTIFLAEDALNTAKQDSANSGKFIFKDGINEIKDTAKALQNKWTDRNKNKDKHTNMLIYSILGIISTGGLFFIFYFLSKKRKKEENTEVNHFSKSDIKKKLNDLKELNKQKESTDFNKKAQELLRDIANFYAQDSSFKTEEEISQLLTKHKTENYANLWKETYQSLQMAQYAGINQENFDRILHNCEELVTKIN
ncbi:BatD family protein [Weeksellaceae bacterium TAE3-ERU29]|nr:BatD family protein [Weeksellaceae bacterium TAE3-ERU29]